MISQQQLKVLLHYNPITGLFTWLARPSNRVHIGDIAGTVTAYGYIQIRLHSVFYKAHRLAWLYMTGDWPTNEIDHRNCVRNDNRWENLRDVTTAMNRQNQRTAHPGSKSGVLGVTPYYRKFVARIGTIEKTLYIGLYDTTEQAHEAYVEAKRRIHEGNTL